MKGVNIMKKTWSTPKIKNFRVGAITKEDLGTSPFDYYRCNMCHEIFRDKDLLSAHLEANPGHCIQMVES